MSFIIYNKFNKKISKVIINLCTALISTTCVAEIIDNRFEVIENGTQVRDLKTKLIWQRCSVGQKLDGNNCLGKPKGFKFNNLNESTTDGWRVPEKDELMSIVDATINKSTINQKAFPNTPASDYWTGTHYAFTTNAWLVNFDYGLSSYADAGHPCLVRLVRSPE